MVFPMEKKKWNNYEGLIGYNYFALSTVCLHIKLYKLHIYFYYILHLD